MSGLSSGLATFNSCNKAGSIPHFTQHLSRYPNDYQALMWRGRAYKIIGKPVEAKADFQKACRVSSGPQKLLAQALIEHVDGNVEQKAAILRNTTRQYPTCSEAWFQLGLHSYDVEKELEKSLGYFERANHLAIANSETKEPCFPWCNNYIGDIYLEKRQVNEARKYYEAAVQSCKTYTVGHLGLSKCDILNNDLSRARTSFFTAKSLNPVLVDWETFDDFRREVQRTHSEASMTSKHRGNEGSSGGRRLTVEQREMQWDVIKKQAPAVRECHGKLFYQSKCKNFWYSKIGESERHGREVKSFLKRYVDRGTTIELDVSIDENMQPMTGKHESGKFRIIKKSDMRGKDRSKKT